MLNVHLHNLSINYAHQPQALYCFDHNGIFFAEPGDIVVLRGSPPDASFLKYLESLGVIKPPLRFMVSMRSPFSPFSVFDDTELQKKISVLINEEKDSECKLESFMVTAYEAAFANAIGATLQISPAQYATYGGKSAFRTHATHHNLPVTRGFANVSSLLALHAAAGALFLRGASEVVVRQDEGVAGFNTRCLTKGAYTEILRQCSFKGILPTTNVHPQYSQRYVVEEWHQHVTQSPSVQCYIDTKGKESIISLHDQIIDPEGARYTGCRSYHWLNDSVHTQLTAYAKDHLRILAREGYRGHIAYNAIHTRDGRILFTEINPRRVVSSYVFQIIRRLGFSKGSLPPYGALEIQNETWKRINHGDLLHRCKDLLYNQTRKSGIIPFDVKLMHARGIVFFLCIGKTQSEVTKLINLARHV